MHVACTHEYANVGFDKLEVESSNEVFPMAADPLLTRVSSPFSSLTIPPHNTYFSPTVIVALLTPAPPSMRTYFEGEIT